MVFNPKSRNRNGRGMLYLRVLLVIYMAFGFLLVNLSVVHAQSSSNIGSPTSTAPTSVSDDSGSLLPLPGGKYPGVQIGKDIRGAEGVVKYLKGTIYDKAKTLLAPVMVLLLAIMGIRLIIAGGKEEDYSKVSQQFFYLLVGALFVFFAVTFSDIFSIYNAEESTFLSTAGDIEGAASKFVDYMDVIIKLARYVLGGVAVFYVVKAGAVIIFNADEETVTKQKGVFLYGFVGFILIIVAEILVRTVFSVPSELAKTFETEGPKVVVDVGAGLGVLTNATNLLLAILSSLFLFTLVVGGVMYALSAGNQERGEKATKLLIGSLIGLVIAFSSYTLVAEFSSGGRKVREATTQERALGFPKPDIPAPAPAPVAPEEPVSLGGDGITAPRSIPADQIPQ